VSGSLAHTAARAAAPTPERAPRPRPRPAGLPLYLQRAALAVDAPNSPLEREAEAVSERIMRMPDGTCCAGCASGGACEEETMRRAAHGSGAGPPPTHGVAQQIAGVTSGGEPLSAGLRGFFEPRLGRDLSGVRIHHDADAAAAARAVEAEAFTVGQHVAFAARQWAPESTAGRRLLAHELVHTGQAGNAVRRQPAGPAEVEMPATWAFALDERKRTDRRYARSLAVADAARIRKAGTLSPEDREEVRAKLAFFEGEAWQAYSQLIRPALVEVTREEIEMPGEGPTPAAPTPAKPRPYEMSEQVARLRRFPEYIDNNITKVSYFTAEQAIIYYIDGTSFELGLVPRWMKPPVVEVDCHTPAEDFRRFEDATTRRFGFIVEPEMGSAPRGMPYQDLLKTYARYVDFYVQPGTGRIVPSRINMLTAPTLCGVLRDSERRFQEQVEMAVELGRGGTVAVSGYAAAGGIPKAPAVGARTAGRIALSPSTRALAREMDDLLATGGTKTITVENVRFIDVTVTRRGSVLAVRRFMSEVPHALRGQGLGPRMAREFEDAAAAIGRQNGAKTVTVDVGIITNPGWRELLEARGYVYVAKKGGWIKTIKL
jgi:hypothetical protein